MILVIGNFGGLGNVRNGQTGRTNNIYRCISEGTGKDVKKIDTSYGMSQLWKSLKCIISAETIVILPAQKALKPLLMLLHAFHKLHSTVYIAIGGWISSYLADDQYLKKACSRCKCIFVQLDSITYELRKMGLENVETLPNFRIYNEKYAIRDRKQHNPIRLVFYARVEESKGIEFLINSLNKSVFDYILDIYGPCTTEYLTHIQGLISSNKRINYKGVIIDNALRILGDYDILIFPTHYNGEGFPGTILEGIYAGVPIIASDWKYNREIIDLYKVGLVYDTFSCDSLLKTINILLTDSALWANLRKNCFTATEQLSPSKIGEILLNELS